MSTYKIDAIIPVGKTDAQPLRMRPVVPASDITNLQIYVTNNLGDSDPVWVAAQNNKAVFTPNFIKDTPKWELGIRVVATSTNPDACIGKPGCYIEGVLNSGQVSVAPFATATGDEFFAMVRAARRGVIDLQTDAGWKVGDVRTITVGVEPIDIVLTSFAEYNNCGNLFQFDFKDQLATGYRMNASNTTVGGYGATEMKTTTLPNIVTKLPQYLRDLLLEFDVVATIGNNLTDLETITGNKLALRSSFEVFNSLSGSKAAEGVYVPYYASATQRTKKRGHSGSANIWWLRSPNSATNFCSVHNNGSSYNNNASIANGVAPFGCI